MRNNFVTLSPTAGATRCAVRGGAPRLRPRAFHLAEGARATVNLRMSKRVLRIMNQKHRLLLRVSASHAARRATWAAPPAA